MVIANWRESSTIPIALQKYLYFRPKYRVRILSCKCNNDTRPSADPRDAFIAAGPEEDEHGHSSHLLKVGKVCSFGDLVYEPSQELVLEPTQQILFKIYGVAADEVNADVLFEKV